MQVESNASLQVGLDVYYVAGDSQVYRALIMHVYAHDRCDLTVYGNVDGQHPSCVVPVYQVRYDSDGEPHSWHKRSDRTNAVLPKGTELTLGRTLARDLPIIIIEEGTS